MGDKSKKSAGPVPILLITGENDNELQLMERTRKIGKRKIKYWHVRLRHGSGKTWSSGEFGDGDYGFLASYMRFMLYGRASDLKRQLDVYPVDKLVPHEPLQCPTKDCDGKMRHVEYTPTTRDISSYIPHASEEGTCGTIGCIMIEPSTYEDHGDGAEGEMLECESCGKAWLIPAMVGNEYGDD